MKVNMKKNFLTQSIAIVFAIFFLPGLLNAQPADIVKLGIPSGKKTVSPGEKFTIELPIIISKGWHINSDKPKDEFLVPTLVTLKGDGVKLLSVRYPKAQDLKFAFSDSPVSVFEGTVKVVLNVQAAAGAAGEKKMKIILDYQACNDQTCAPPATAETGFAFTVKAGDSAAVSQADTAAIQGKSPEATGNNNNPPAVQPKESEPSSIAERLEKSGLLLSLIFVFLAGLALNLTPCVYPIIPITIGYFGGQAEGKTSRLVMLGLLYMLGMALTYSVVGVVTSLSGAVFGTLMQNPFVVIGIAVLFIALALSQFGLYEFKMPDSLVEKAGDAKGGMFGAFFMGLTMGIVAAPCIGPFVLGLVTYVAVKGDPFYGFIMFFTLALGLGFPYLLLAIFSGKIKQLPRSGAWMEGVKHIFGLLLLGMAFYFLDPILPKAVRGYPLPIFGIIAAAVLLFFDKTANNVKPFKTFKYIFSVIVLAVAVYALIPKQKLAPDWKKFDTTAYEQALKNGDKVFIDFYADWCIPCKELDHLTFSDPRVIKAMDEFTCFKVDMTETSEANEDLRKKFSVVGMPTLLIYDSSGKLQPPITGFLNADELLGRLAQVK